MRITDQIKIMLAAMIKVQGTQTLPPVRSKIIRSVETKDRIYKLHATKGWRSYRR